MNSKIYTILLLLISLFSAEVLASSYIKPYLNDDDEALVYVSSLNFTQVLTEMSGDGSSEGSAIKIYAPVDDSRPVTTNTNLYGGNILSSSGEVRLRLDINNSDSNDRYLTLAYQKDSKWYITYQYLVPSATSDEDFNVDFNASVFWDTDSSELSGLVENHYLYLFYTTTQYSTLGTGQEVDESALGEDGLYYRIYLSARTYDSAPYTAPTLHYVIKGDGRLFMDYTGSLLADAYKAVAVKHGAGVSTSVDIFTAEASGELVDTDYPACSGERQQLTVSDLDNTVEYNLAVACVDKFMFATNFSVPIKETPELIEPFLEKNACYFISAGFGHEHFVLKFFRDFRDHVLVKNSWGKKFVGWYYRSAPKYAGIVYKSNVLSFFVRMGAYFLYFILSLWKLLFVLLPIIIVSLILVLRKRNVNA